MGESTLTNIIHKSKLQKKNYIAIIQTDQIRFWNFQHPWNPSADIKAFRKIIEDGLKLKFKKG